MTPFCFDIEVTQRCNQGCRYCYLGKPMGSDMTEDTARQVVRYIADCAQSDPLWKAMHVNFYGGEPVLNFPVVRYIATELDVALGTRPLHLNLFTNGASATDGQVAECRDMQIIPRRSTAGCPEAASLTRPGDYTERWVNEGKLWQDYDSPHRLVVTPETAHHLASSVRWLHSEGYYGPVDVSTDDYAYWPQEAAEAIRDEIGWLAGEFVAQHREGRMLGIENFTQIAKALYGRPGTISLGCGAGGNTVGITWDGYIVPCHRFFREPYPYGHSHILDGGAPSFGDDFTAYREDCACGHEHHRCRKCPAREGCSHGCPHVSLHTMGVLGQSPRIRCDTTKTWVTETRWIDSMLRPRDDQWWTRTPTPCNVFGP